MITQFFLSTFPLSKNLKFIPHFILFELISAHNLNVMLRISLVILRSKPLRDFCSIHGLAFRFFFVLIPLHKLGKLNEKYEPSTILFRPSLLMQSCFSTSSFKHHASCITNKIHSNYKNKEYSKHIRILTRNIYNVVYSYSK